MVCLMFNSKDIQFKIHELFIANIPGFFGNEFTQTNSLVDMNKKYILLIHNHIKKNYPIQPDKIKIHNDSPVKESITFEDIQNERKSKFEQDFNRRQEEFEDLISIKKPPVPEFADKDRDNPIKEMDKILKEMQSQRKYDIEQINRNYNSDNNIIQVDNWLKPQETSLKTEKFINKQEIKSSGELDNQGSRFKFLNNIEQQQQVKDKKNVSFSNIQEINTFDTQDDEEEDGNDTIFTKLKKVSNTRKDDNITLQIHESSINEDRISKLEREIKNINNKMDKIIEILSKK